MVAAADEGVTVAAPTALIDCDVHNTVPNVEALFPYLSQYWVEHVNNSVFKGAGTTYYPANAPVSAVPANAASARERQFIGTCLRGRVIRAPRRPSPRSFRLERAPT